MEEILQKCKEILRRHYKNRFLGLVLYGSMVQQNRLPSANDSDIDLLVLLSPPIDYLQELHTIVDLLYPVQLESSRLISAKPAPFDAYEKGSLALYRNARQEGVRI
ncbi:nucleotidyltransferase domain-containing protein [Candidatus Parcubacteria bacterium]|nr:MAG: nucleotidyltransferase domain-containing protein [Candidatus Parcubacteria bacterium]